MDILDGEFLPIVTEKLEFDYRDWNQQIWRFHEISGF